MSSNTAKLSAYAPGYIPHDEPNAGFQVGKRSSKNPMATSFAAVVKKQIAPTVSIEKAQLTKKLSSASRSSALNSVKKSKASSTLSSKAKATYVKQPLSPAKKAAVNPGSDPSNKKRVQVSSPDRESASDSSKQATNPSPLPSKKLNYAAALKGTSSGLSISSGEDTMDRIIESGVPIREILAAKEKASQSDSSDTDVEEVFDETAARTANKKGVKSSDPFSGDEDSSVEILAPPEKNKKAGNRESSSTPINWEEAAFDDDVPEIKRYFSSRSLSISLPPLPPRRNLPRLVLFPARTPLAHLIDLLFQNLSSHQPSLLRACFHANLATNLPRSSSPRQTTSSTQVAILLMHAKTSSLGFVTSCGPCTTATTLPGSYSYIQIKVHSPLTLKQAIFL